MGRPIMDIRGCIPKSRGQRAVGGGSSELGSDEGGRERPPLIEAEHG
jgi:hypothetical protein